MAAVLFLIGKLSRRRFDRLREDYHSRREELVDEARRMVGKGDFVFEPYYSEILYLSSDRPAFVKIKRARGGLEKILVEGNHILGVRLEEDPVESMKKRGAPLGPQFQRLLVVSLVGARARLTFYFDSADVAREWSRRIEHLAALARSGSTTHRS